MLVNVLRKCRPLTVFHLQGSFEKIGNICDPASLPDNYMQEAQALALEGCYVLGVSMRTLDVARSEEALRMSRDEVEAGLNFTALLAFRNELKHDTREAIIEMKEGNVRPVMITGGMPTLSALLFQVSESP